MSGASTAAPWLRSMRRASGRFSETAAERMDMVPGPGGVVTPLVAFGSAPQSRRNAIMARCDRGRSWGLTARRAAMRGVVPTWFAEFMGMFSSKR